MVQTWQATECSFIPTATSNSTAKVYTWRNRVLQRAFERLELLDAKVSRAVLRGRDGGNTILLPDTDVRDAEWIADLLQHVLLTSNFIPAAAQRELRELTRYRTSLVQERARAVNRLQKTLEDTNLKLGDVATDILGKSARAILEALLSGQTDPAVLADLARGRLKAKRAQLEEALVGVLKAHHRFMLTEHLLLIDTLDEAITRASQEIAHASILPLSLTHLW